MNLYTEEKLMELERERLARLPNLTPTPVKPRKTVLGPLAAGAGRTLRRVGEGLEHWGSPQPEHEAEHAHHM